MALKPFAAQNLREWAEAIETENFWHPSIFLNREGMAGKCVQDWFHYFVGLTDLEMRALFPDYTPCAFRGGSEDFGILFRLFLAEAIESGDIT